MDGQSLIGVEVAAGEDQYKGWDATWKFTTYLWVPMRGPDILSRFDGSSWAILSTFRNMQIYKMWMFFDCVNREASKLSNEIF